MNLKEMRPLMKSRGLNNLHRYLLMKADLMAAECCNSGVREAFEKAVSSAAKAGFTQDAALGNELAAEYSIDIGDEFLAKHHFTIAKGLYHEWGALAKAKQLQCKRGNYMKGLNQRGSLRNSIYRYGVSGEEGGRHNSLDLDLLSGPVFPSSNVK